MSDERDKFECACRGILVAEKEKGLGKSGNGGGQKGELRCAEVDKVAGPAMVIRLMGGVCRSRRNGRPGRALCRVWRRGRAGLGIRQC